MFSWPVRHRSIFDLRHFCGAAGGHNNYSILQAKSSAGNKFRSGLTNSVLKNNFAFHRHGICNRTQIASSPIIMLFTLTILDVHPPKYCFVFTTNTRRWKALVSQILFFPAPHCAHQTRHGINSSLYEYHYFRCVHVLPGHYRWFLSVIPTALARTPITSLPITLHCS